LSRPFCTPAGSRQSMTRMRCQSRQACNHDATLLKCPDATLDKGHQWYYILICNSWIVLGQEVDAALLRTAAGGLYK